MRHTAVIRVLSILAAIVVVGAIATFALLVTHETNVAQAAPTVARARPAVLGTLSSTQLPQATTVPPPATTLPASDSDSAVGRCETRMLSAELRDTQGAAGTVYSHLVFTNISAQPCTLAGYPGVSFVDGSGGQIGAPVPRVSGQSGEVTLSSGSSASAVFALHTAYVGSVEGCQPTEASGVRVYPPDDSSALFIPSPSRVCANPATDGSASITAVATG